MRRRILGVLLALAAAPAAAQERPQVTPTRDVAVTYRFLGGAAAGGGPQGITVSWQAATGLMRSDIPGTGWLVADTRGGRGFIVMEGMRMIMDIPVAQAMAQHGLSPDGDFRREGTATVAGLRCTVWNYRDGGREGRACITADGVMLRGEGTQGGRSGGLEATSVTFGAQDPARFRRPQGYGAMQMPGGLGGVPRLPGR